MRGRFHRTIETGTAGILAVLCSASSCENDVFVPPIDEPLSGATTLYARDPLRHNYDFVRADYGAVIQGGEVRNAGSHIDYSNYREGTFTVGIQGGEEGVILDLGTDGEVAARIGRSQTVAGGQGFAGLAYKGGRFNDPNAAPLFGAPRSAESSAANEGHVYVLRITRASKTDLLVKLLVTGLTPGREASFQWIRFQ